MPNEYDKIAKLYDPLLYLFLNQIRKEVLNELWKYKEHSIIDLCCGTGDQLKRLAKNGFKSLHCLDISGSMLEIAKKGDFAIKYYNQDATKTSFEDESFDIAIISFAIHEKDRVTQEKFIEEAHRIIKKDGLILIVDYDFDQNTTKLVQYLITIVERIAGKEHYYNFKNFIRNNGLLSLIDKDKFVLLKKKKMAFKGITISIYQKI